MLIERRLRAHDRRVRLHQLLTILNIFRIFRIRVKKP